MRGMIRSLMKSRKSLKSTQDESGRANILGVPIHRSGADTKKIKENIYELTAEVYKALTSPLYTGNTIKKENDILMMNNNIEDIGYTGDGDRDSQRTTFFTKKTSKAS